MHIPFLNLTQEYLLLEKEIDKKIKEVLKNSQFTYGVETQKFERNFAKLTGNKYAIAVNSGTSSLILTLQALNLNPSDEVITTAFTFIAVAEAIVHAGAKPVLVDIDQSTLNMDINKLESVITKKTKAIIAVHTYGVCLDMDLLLKMAVENNIPVIEDASHALGSFYKKRSAGSFGLAGCFSLYPSKTLGAYGNAGVIVTHDQKLTREIRMLANHGIQKGQDISHKIGFNANINNLQAGILNVKMKYLRNKIAVNKGLIEKYIKELTKIKQIKLQEVPWFCRPSFYVFTIQTDKRDQLVEFLRKKGVETKIHYRLPLHLQPSMKFLGYQEGAFPNAEKVCGSILSLPMHPYLKKAEIQIICNYVDDFFHTGRTKL